MADVSIFQRLKKLGLAVKKAFTYLEANEEKRQTYQNLTKDISEEDLDYVDESGMEESSCKEYMLGQKLDSLSKASKAGKHIKE